MCINIRAAYQDYIAIYPEVSMTDQLYKEIMTMPNKDFPMKVLHFERYGIGQACMSPHWHDEIELHYICEGSAEFHIGNQSFIATQGDLVVVNCNELHASTHMSDKLVYDCIILDPHILNSRFLDQCDAKYITPIIDNRILFNHHITGDKQVEDCITTLTSEYSAQAIGYELAIKATLFQLVVLMLRDHIAQILSDSQMQHRMKNIERLNETILYIQQNLSTDLTVESLSQLVHLSKYHFCRLFKQMTGHTVSQFINAERIREADRLLKDTSLSISEIAYAVGYNDTSYFSRVYKQFKGYAPSDIRSASSGYNA